MTSRLKGIQERKGVDDYCCLRQFLNVCCILKEWRTAAGTALRMGKAGQSLEVAAVWAWKASQGRFLGQGGGKSLRLSGLIQFLHSFSFKKKRLCKLYFNIQEENLPNQFLNESFGEKNKQYEKAVFKYSRYMALPNPLGCRPVVISRVAREDY